MRTFLALILISIVTVACTSSPISSDGIITKSVVEPTPNVVLTSDVEWGLLNPARGDMSPKAGTIWGDRTNTGPSGFLVKFADGFSSPPHIHNVTYRGLVISGTIHNDDPDAKNMWLRAGSFWTQVAGETHITSAEGANNMAYIEIEEGPYLVLPAEEEYDNGETSVNVDISNIIWLDASDIKWLNQHKDQASSNEPKVAFLWVSTQDDQLSGTLIKLPAGFSGKIYSHGSTFRAVVIHGRPLYLVPGETEIKTLEPGSYFSSKGESVHEMSSQAEEESIIYVRMEGKFEVVPVVK